MFVPFEKINDRARVWIYQSNRKLNSDETKIISEALSSFTESWLVHGRSMEASFDIRWNQFIILAADEGVNAASGCSIDDSVRTLKRLSTELHTDFFDRGLVAFKKGDDVIVIPSTQLKQKLNDGFWNGDTLVFNNLVATKQELEPSWLVPAASTWLKRYLPQQTVVS
jgi:hypothetical protein